MRSMVEGRRSRTEAYVVGPSTAFGGPPPHGFAAGRIKKVR